MFDLTFDHTQQLVMIAQFCELWKYGSTFRNMGVKKFRSIGVSFPSWFKPFSFNLWRYVDLCEVGTLYLLNCGRNRKVLCSLMPFLTILHCLQRF